MSIITTYPLIGEVAPADLLIIADMSVLGTPTRTVSVQQLLEGATGGVTSVGLSAPSAFTVSNSPVTTSGTLTFTGAGTTAQYIDGTGSLQTFPTIPSGGVTQIVAGQNVTISPSGGTGVVTINASGGGGSGSVTSVSASTAGDALDVAVTNATTTPDLAFTWAGTNNQYINGAGDLATLPATATTYNLDADQDGLNVDLRLTPSTGAADVVQFTAGSGITLTETGNNNITIAASGSGGLTSVGASSNYLTIANSPLTSNGVIQVNMPANGVPVGTYTNATVTVDQYGFVTNASSGSTIPSNIVETVTTIDGQFIELTPNSPASGAVAVTADLSATGTPSSTTFLRGDNTWAVPTGGGGMTQWFVDDGGMGGFPVQQNDAVMVGGSAKINVTTSTPFKSITWTHENTTRTDTTSTAAPAAGATFTVIDSITQDATGHPTAVNVKTVTMPAGGGGGTTYDLASAQDGDNVDITLTPATGAVDTVQLTAGSGITLTDNGSNNITIDAAAGGSGLWTATGNDIYNNNSNAVVIGKTSVATDTTAALEVSGRVSQVDLGGSTFFGFRAGKDTSTSNSYCTAFGYLALYNNVSGINNTAIGYYALLNTTAGGNTGVGKLALSSNTSGINNVAIGNDALSSSVTGISNTAVGGSSLKDVTSGGNVGVGYRALEGGTTGSSNTGLGAFALLNIATSTNNTAVGSSAMENVASGIGRNVAVGNNAGSNYGTGTPTSLTVCNDSIFIGDNSKALGNGATNEIVIGQGATGNGQNTTTLGNDDTEKTYLRGVVVLEGYTFANLPASPVAGMRAYITDGPGPPTFGQIVSNGNASYKMPVFYNGSNWIYA